LDRVRTRTSPKESFWGVKMISLGKLMRVSAGGYFRTAGRRVQLHVVASPGVHSEGGATVQLPSPRRSFSQSFQTSSDGAFGRRDSTPTAALACASVSKVAERTLSP
jgi:hypothetical protein